ncbi:MAG: glycine zipper domain-containing protein [Actinomycetota bacterium]
MNETNDQKPVVTGLFNDRDSAERAYSALESRGYSRDDVNLMMSDDSRNRHFGEGTVHTELGSKALEGAGTGSAIGGTVGAIIGGIAAIGTNILLPGLGLIVWGPLAAALAGAGAGGLTGGLIGALVGSGIPKEQAAEYESGIKEGGIFMGVNPRTSEDADYIQKDWSGYGKNIHAVGTGTGVVGGAVTGAAVGSVIPVVGTAIGGVVGGVAGGVAGHEIAEKVNPDDKIGDKKDF